MVVVSIPAALSVNEGESVMVCATMSGFRGRTQRAVNVMLATATGTGRTDHNSWQ